VKPIRPGDGSDGAAVVVPSPAPVPNSYGKPVSTEVGLASWYGPPYAGRKGADGTVYDQNAMTAAHLTLPMGTMVRVTNLTNNESVVVKITDRGPFVRGRIIDLSLAAAKATGVYRAGVAKVKVEAFATPIKANADPGGHWCVQIGAFARESDAVKLKADLMRRYTTAKVIEFPGPTGYWVRVNPKFPDKRNATEVADGIHPKDPAAEPYLIRTD
jgi:rare lipoprotein A